MKHPVSRWLAGLAIMVFSCLTSGQVGARMPAFEATYKIMRSGFGLGDIQIRFQIEPDGHYHYESLTQVTGIVAWFNSDRVHESSRGIMDDGGVWPHYYRFQRTGGEQDKLAEITFDWEAGRVKNVVDGQPWKMDIPEGALDKLIVQIAMMLNLQQDVKDQHFKVADGGKLKDYGILISEQATLDLPAGQFETLKVEKEPENKRRKTWLWLAPELGYLPVQIMRVEKDGSVYYSVLDSFSESLRTDK